MINQLTNVLVRLEDQIRRVSVEYERRIQQLQSRLLELLNMHEQLNPENGNTSDTQ